MKSHLGALGNAGDVGTAAVGLSTSDGNVRPSPASARLTAAAGDNDIVAGAGNSASTSDVLDDKTGDGDASASCALQITAVVVLLDESTIPSCLC